MMAYMTPTPSLDEAPDTDMMGHAHIATPTAPMSDMTGRSPDECIMDSVASHQMTEDVAFLASTSPCNPVFITLADGR